MELIASVATTVSTVENSEPLSCSLDDNMDDPQQFRSELESVDTTSKSMTERCSEQYDGENDGDVESCNATITFAITENGGDGGHTDEHDNDHDISSEMMIAGGGGGGGQEGQETLVSPSYVKIVIGVLLLVVVFFVIIDSVFGKNYVSKGITIFLEWIRENRSAGMVAYILVYIIATLICVPGALLTLGAGFVFSTTNDGSLMAGVALGTLAVFIGSSIGALVAFLLARYLLYDRVRRLSQRYSIFEALDIALSEKGLRIMCLLRLSPITPFVLLNYISGVTTVTLQNYVLSIFCMVPGMVLYVFLGASAGSLTDKTENKTVTIVAVSLGVLFGVLAIGLTSHYARNELNKEVDLVRSRLYNRTTSRVNRHRYRRHSLRKQRSRNRRRLDRKRLGRLAS